MPVEHTQPAAARPRLCSLADVRGVLQKKDSDTSQDALIETLIDGGSAAVMEWCERQFAPVEEHVTKTFEWERESELVSFAPWDLQSLDTPESSVVADTDNATPYTLTKEEFRLWPASKRFGVYMGIRVRPFGASYGSITWEYRQLQVTGKWGFPAIPQAVVEATALTVASRLRNNVAAFRPPGEDAPLVQMPRRGIPLEAQQLVQHFKRAIV